MKIALPSSNPSPPLFTPFSPHDLYLHVISPLPLYPVLSLPPLPLISPLPHSTLSSTTPLIWSPPISPVISPPSL